MMAHPLLLLFFLLLLPTDASASTVAISHGSSTICAITTREETQTITCARPNSTSFSINRPYSFSSISGGRDYICGVRSTGTAIFCLDLTGQITSSSSFKRIYDGHEEVSNLAVGEDHVAGILAGEGVCFWRPYVKFPSESNDQLTSLTSGNRFTCGIEQNSNSVKCWGSDGVAQAIQTALSNETMVSISAGDSMVCGVTISGDFICSGSGGALRPLVSSPFELSSPAVGKTHVCGLTGNGSALCWREDDGQKDYIPMDLRVNTSFEFLVAGGDLTCGLESANLKVICWRLDGSLLDLQLPKALPGPCVESCKCPHVPDSAALCGGSKVICNCEPSQGPPPPPPPPPMIPPPESHDGKSTGHRVEKILLLVFGVVGSFAGLCCIIYCVWVAIFHRKKKVHNSDLPSVIHSARELTSSPPAAPTNSFGSTIISFKSYSASSSLFGRRIRRQRSGPSSTKVPDRAEQFTFFELSLATDNFSLSARIGWGSFGSVYRGKLLDGREVAVKRSEPGARSISATEKESEFYSELAFLSRLHHKNLVNLLGFCEDGGQQLLVYDYMSNGSLYDHLHLKSTAEAHSPSSDSPLHASWKLRLKLLLDAARGIEYLHNYAVPPIIHRDIKSSNILIDGTWTARISDFGLSLNNGSPETLDVGGGANRKKAGTVGYMDPEYYGQHQLTTKSDVYGFGVVMLEVLTGKKAIFAMETGGELMHIVDYALGSVRAGEVGRVLDRRVAGQRPASETEALELVAYTATSCVTLTSMERPTMKNVVSNLEVALSLCERAASGSTSGREGSEDMGR